VADVTPFIVWFGVLLAINMQTSFMHPPFGFALFYLRSVAPAVPYADKTTGRTIAPVTTGQIYWGAVPFVIIQLVMVTLVLLVPSLAMPAKTKPVSIPAAVQHTRDGNDANALGARGFSLTPLPPAIEGAPGPSASGPGAPILDMRGLPNFDAGERTLPQRGN
jgi:hypothetical protein